MDTMKKQLEQRLGELRRDEFKSGQTMLADPETKQTELRQSLLRISGAIEVLEEELAKCNEATSDTESSAEKVTRLG